MEEIMAQQLQGLLDKINQDGIAKAQEQSKAIIAEANRKANEIIEQAKQEAEQISKNAKLEADTEAVINKLWDEYELTYNTALEYKKPDFDMNAGQKDAASLRTQIKGLGNINIDAT